MKTLIALSILSLFVSKNAFAADSVYPLEMVDLLKEFTAPLENPGDCDSEGGLIPVINCHLNDFGVTGAGTFFGAQDDGCVFRIEVETTDGRNDYQFITKAYSDCDGTGWKHFMNYWMSHQGGTGRVQILPHRTGPNPDAKMEAIVVTWNSLNPGSKILYATIERLQNSSSTDWSNREFATQYVVQIDEIRNIAIAAVGFNGLIGNEGEFAAFKMAMVRNSTHSLVQGSLCSDDLSDCVGKTKFSTGDETGAAEYECVENTGDSTVRGRAIETTASLKEISKEGPCGELKSHFAVTNIEPTENTSGLFSVGGLLIFEN